MRATPTATPTPVPTGTPKAIAPSPGPVSAQSIYLGDIAQGAVLIYSSAAQGSVGPDAAIAGSNTGFTDSSGPSPIYGIAVDEHGTVYVLTQTLDATRTLPLSEAIQVFPAGSTGNVVPAHTIELSTSIDAESLAYAGSQLYVSDDAGAGAVDVYASNANGVATPVRTFTSVAPFADPPLKVSVDTAGRAFVSTVDETATAANEGNQAVYEFPAAANGSVAASATVSGSATGLGNGVLEAAVVDPTDRVDAVLDDATTDTITDVDEFSAGANGNAAPSTAFSHTISDGPVDAAVDSGGNLYVTGIGNGTNVAAISVFAPGSATAKQTILAYEAQLPLIAIGPYVATSPSGAMSIGMHRRQTTAAALRTFRQRRRHRVGRKTP